jgi:peptidyl-prolyl cis-trans isomerase B (cyclophilin B)
MAIASLICAFLFAPLGIVFGHLSLSQIRRTGEQGRGLAVAGLVIGYMVTVMTIVALVAGVALIAWMGSMLEESSDRGGLGVGRHAAGPLPTFVAPANLGSNCSYPATATPPAKAVTLPRTGAVPTVPAVIRASMGTDDGPIALTLDNGKAPCTVNSFVSLAQQGFFDNTPCHRLTTERQMAVLQCGDPTGSGTGGPGYRFVNEYPTNQYRPFDPALKDPVIYPRGSLVMANSGPDTNGSQFFIVYRDTVLPPTYTVFGSVDETGLRIVDNVASSGVIGSGDDGQPKEPLTITDIRLG